MASPAVYWRKKKTTFLFLNKKGTLLSFTKINNPPKGFGKQAYWVGIVEFPEGTNQIGQLILEGKEPKIGQAVIGVIRKTRQPNNEEVITYGVKFKLL